MNAPNPLIPLAVSVKREDNYTVAESVPDATGFSESQDDLGAGAAAVAPIPESRQTKAASGYRISASAREMLLEQANCRLEAQRDRLLYALSDLRHRDGCFCEVSIGNPMMQGRHTRACEKATAVTKDVERWKRPC